MTAWILALILGLMAHEPAPWSDTYLTTAIDIADAAKLYPLPGIDGTERMAAQLVALGWWESRFSPQAIDPSGRTVGRWQVDRAWPDPYNARTAARLVAKSYEVCKGHPREELLGWYTAGHNGCSNKGGLAASRPRVALAQRLFKAHPPPLDAAMVD